MRAGTKLAAVTIIAVGLAAVSPFFAGTINLGPVSDAVVGAEAWLADAVPRLLAHQGDGASAEAATLPAVDADSGVDPTQTASPATAGQFDLAQATPAKPTPAPAKPATAPPASAAKPAATAPATATPLNLSQGDLALVYTLLRNTLAAVHQADLTGNYTVLRDLGAPGFRDNNTAAALADIFAPIRAKNIDLSTAVLLDPNLTMAKLNDQGMLDIAGSMQTQPVPVRFEMLYQGVQNVWQLFGISLSADTGGQAAVQAAPAAQATTGSVTPPKPTPAPAASK